MGLPTPINWLKAGIEPPDHLVIQFTVVPKDKEHYPIFRNITDENDGVYGEMPGPVTYMVAGPVGKSREYVQMVAGSIVNNTMPQLLSKLQEKFSENVESREMEVDSEFTVNNWVDDEKMKKIIIVDLNIFG